MFAPRINTLSLCESSVVSRTKFRQSLYSQGRSLGPTLRRRVKSLAQSRRDGPKALVSWCR